MTASAPAATVAPPSATMKWSLRSRRCSARQGSRFMRGMSVETPQSEATGRQQGGGVALHGLRLRARGELHLSERIALLGRDADAARDHVGDPGDVGAAAAHQDLLRLLATGA